MSEQSTTYSLEKKLEQLEKQRILLENRAKTKERKERTRHLILLGAEICSRLQIRDPTENQIQAVADFILEQERRGGYVTKYIKQREG